MQEGDFASALHFIQTYKETLVDVDVKNTVIS